MPEISLQPAAAASPDTYLDESNPGTSRGADATSRWGRNNNANNDAMFKFDLSAIAKGSKILEAVLSLYLTGNNGSPTNTVMWRILEGNSAWVEAADWNTIDGAAAPWAGSAGAETVGTDIAAGYLFGPSTIDLTGLPKWVDFIMNASEFQALIDVGNYGFKLGLTTRAGGDWLVGIFSSSDHATAGQHPKLYVQWIEPSGILYEYRFNKYDPLKRVFDAKGEQVQLSEVRPNNWIFTEGFDLPSSKVFSSLVVDPRVSYIKGTSYDEDGRSLGIETDRNQFAAAIIERMARGI
jgi:hypothetical protein